MRRFYPIITLDFFARDNIAAEWIN